MRREKSLHRSDSFQTRLQFLREQAQMAQSGPYSSYAAALSGHSQSPPSQQGFQMSQQQHQLPQGMYPVGGWGPHPQGIPAGAYPPPPGPYGPHAQAYPPPPGPPPQGPHPQTFVPYSPYQQTYPAHPYPYPPHIPPPPPMPREPTSSSRPDSQASSPPITR